MPIFRLATRDEFLISIIEVLREFLSDFRFARRGKTQLNKSAENLWLPIRHFLPP
jgi:hypothetical protein